MKQKLLNKFWLRVGMIVAVMTTALAGTAWADTQEIALNNLYQNGTKVTAKTVCSTSGSSLTFTDEDGAFSIKITRNSGNQPGFYTSSGYIRFYENDVVEVESLSGAVMSSIVITTINQLDASVPVTVSPGALSETTWSGSASKVTFTGTGTNKWNKLAITYSSSGTPTPTTYTVTYNANGGTGTMTDSNSPYASGATVTVLDNEFTRTDYDFTGWNTAADGSGTGYDEGDTFTINANTTLYAQWEEQASGDAQWVLTSLADLTASDVFVIVGNNGNNYALSSANGTSSAPPVVAVTVENSQITSSVTDVIKWTISGNATDGYIFYPNGSTTTWLYCTNTNNGVRVGTNDNKTFTVDNGYLKHAGTSRYVGIYDSQDWRCYTSNTGNIANQTFTFYKRVEAGAPQAPSFTITNNDELAYGATSGSFNFTVNNPVTGGATTVSEDVDWISNAAVSGNTVTFTTTANEATTSREGVITLTYTYGEENITKEVTVTQEGAPVIYTTIPALFAKATEVGNTETNVNVTFGNWVVSGVSGSNVFVTDNNGNGFIIYKSNHGFTVNDKLSGTVEGTPLKLYKGSAEFTDLTTSTAGLTVTQDGVITVMTNKTIAELSGVNTGAVITLSNLTYDGTNLSDGTNTIKPYSSLYSSMSLESGKIYNITGVYQQYDTTKEILPRSVADIEEVGEVPPTPVTGDQYALYSGELVEGDYIIYYNGYAMNTTVTSDRLQYAEVTPVNNLITTDNAAIVWHIAPSGEYWTIYSADAEAYAAGTGAKNKAQMLADGTDDKALWTVSRTETETYEFVNKANAANKVNANLRNNSTYGFACYSTSTGGALSLYKKVEQPYAPETITLNGSGYATFASTSAVDFTNAETNGYSAWAITGVNGSEITFSQITGAVAAGTGVLLKGTANAQVTIEYTTSGAAPAGNLLEGVVAPKAIEAGQYYGLSGAKFVKVNTGTVPAGKALLPANVVEGTGDGDGVKTLTFNFDEDATAIKAIDNGQLTTDGVIYNLAGQRLSKMQKGINIVNGRKVLY